MRFSPSLWTMAAVTVLAHAGFGQFPAAYAQEVKSANDLVNGLQPVKTRGFDPAAPQREAKQKELNAKLRDFKTRQITVEERDQVGGEQGTEMSMSKSCSASIPPKSCQRRCLV